MKLIPGLEEAYKKSIMMEDDTPPDTRRYVQCIIDYANAWADEMEKALEKGEPISGSWERIGHEVDRRPEFGVSGYMYGMAVQILATYWIHGDILRVLHNAQYGHHGEGVVNPAILTIGGDHTEEEVVDAIKEAARKAGGTVLSDEETKEFLKNLDKGGT